MTLKDRQFYNHVSQLILDTAARRQEEAIGAPDNLGNYEPVFQCELTSSFRMMLRFFPEQAFQMMIDYDRNNDDLVSFDEARELITRGFDDGHLIANIINKKLFNQMDEF